MSDLKNRRSAVDKYRGTLAADERATLERLVGVGKGCRREGQSHDHPNDVFHIKSPSQT